MSMDNVKENKPVSFRLNEDSIERFKKVCGEYGLNQAEMFENILNSFEMSKAKGLIPSRSKEIEVFQKTVNSVLNMYINALTVNENSEISIRESLALELNTKDKSIKMLQDQNSELKEKVKEANKELKAIEDTNSKVLSENDKYSKEIAQKDSIIENLQTQIRDMTANIQEYKGFKAENIELKTENTKLKEEASIEHHANEDLNSKLENSQNMISFYKEQLEKADNAIKVVEVEMKEEKENNKVQIDKLEANYKQEIKEIKKEQHNNLIAVKSDYENRLQEKEESIKSSYEVEQRKLQLELEEVKIKLKSSEDRNKSLSLANKKHQSGNKKTK